MKKSLIAIMAALALTAPTMACPLWECQYDINDYNCGCSRSGSYIGSCYNEYSCERQPIYCQYCGHETWDCVCGNYYDSGNCGSESGSGGCIDYDYDYACDYGYSCSGGCSMSHWANIRDCYGNIIGQAGCGDSVEVCGVESDTGRVLIYDYSTGCYGSVLAECVYGGYQWDGTGDNGYYNSYQGDGCGYTDYGYSDCGYSSGSSCGSCGNAYSNQGYVTYCETIVQRCVTYGFGYGYGYGCGYGKGWC